jgi:hypothetical protein
MGKHPVNEKTVTSISAPSVSNISGDAPEKSARGEGKRTPWFDSFLRRVSPGPDTVPDEFSNGKQDEDLLH